MKRRVETVPRFVSFVGQYNNAGMVGSRFSTDTSGKREATGPPVGAYLILQLHDELMYEVGASSVGRVAAVVRDCMENALRLAVMLPVKVMSGPTWAALREITPPQ